MFKSLLNKKAAIVALAATAVLGGGVAFAYPSGTDMTVSATAAPTNDPGHVGETKVLVTVSAANPGCSTRIKVDNGHEVLLPPGTTTTAIYLTSGAGRHSVQARTVGCKKGAKEHAKSKFVTIDAKATGASTAEVRKNYQVNLSGFEPKTEITVTATLTGSSPLVQLVKTDSADRRGKGKVKFKFRTPGTWVITTVGGGVTTSYEVVVS